MPEISIVTPAYNEEQNLPLLYKRLAAVLGDVEWEWIVVDDHSNDQTFEAIHALSTADRRVRGLRFARNFGSHTALACGLHHCRGACAMVMAADLQDPPETLPELLAKWRTGVHVVWAVRAGREGETAATVGFARMYYWLMRNVAGIKEIASTGADFFLIDRRVIDALNKFGESNVSLLALITWMGFRQDRISYTKQARVHGTSGWSLEKKLKLVADSVTSFTYVPIRLMSYTGFVFAIIGFLYAGWITFNAIVGHPVEGWSSLMVIVLIVSGIQMVMMGILGEYLWRALDESRRRPRYIIEDCTPEGGMETMSSIPDFLRR